MEETIKVMMIHNDEKFDLTMTFEEFLRFYEEPVFWYVKEDGQLWQINTGFVSSLVEI